MKRTSCDPDGGGFTCCDTGEDDLQSTSGKPVEMGRLLVLPMTMIYAPVYMLNIDITVDVPVECQQEIELFQSNLMDEYQISPGK